MRVSESVRLPEAVCTADAGGKGAGRFVAGGEAEGVAGKGACDLFAGLLEDVPVDADVVPCEEVFPGG